MTFKKGYTPWNKGIKMSSKHCKKLKGRVPWNKDTKGVMQPNKTSFKKGNSNWVGRKHSKESKKKMSEARQGRFLAEEHPTWKGGRKRYFGWIARRVLESFYGMNWEDLCLPERPVIHHINSDCKDNRFENLCIMSSSDHTRLHHMQGDLVGETYLSN